MMLATEKWGRALLSHGVSLALTRTSDMLTLGVTVAYTVEAPETIRGVIIPILG